MTHNPEAGEKGAGSAHPWRFKAVIEGDLVHISATFDLDGIETFRHKLLALAQVLDTPSITTEPESHISIEPAKATHHAG